MARPFPDDLLRAAVIQLRRSRGARGKLPAGQVRRSISTVYYALYHFLLDEVARTVIGTNPDLLARRRVFIRSLSHGGMRATFERLTGANVHDSVEDFLRPRGAAGPGRVPVPPFVNLMATAFLDAQKKRHDADYNLNEPLSENDSGLLHRRVKYAMGQWKSATAAADKDMKAALCILLLLQGKIRTT